MSKPRPIHTMHRTLRETPDEAEPSSSYEQESFLGRAEDEMEDEFHRRLSSSNNNSQRQSPTTGTSNNNNNNNNNNSSNNNTTTVMTTRRGTSPQQPLVPPGKQTSLRFQKKRGTSGGGLLGTALQQPQPQQQQQQQQRQHSQTTITSSSSSSSSKDKKKKDIKKQRAEARRLKMEQQLSEPDYGSVVGGEEAMATTEDEEATTSLSPFDEAQLRTRSSDEWSSSDRGNNSLLATTYQSPSIQSISNRNTGGILFGKSSSLIFPNLPSSAFSPFATTGGKEDASSIKRQKINLILDACETVRFPFKKKLILNNMNLSAADIPVKDLSGTSLGNSLHKLSLAGNRLLTIPPKLVTCLPNLKHLDLSQCELHQLPERWKLPQLKRLVLSHNRLTDFPEESMLEGLLELQELNLYGNKLSVMIVPQDTKLLAKLETLDLGYNDLAFIPEDLDRLKSLRTLKVMNNYLEKIPMRVCDMELKAIDVSSNPVIQPPIETCERGICSMKRYYHCLRMEEQSKQKALEALQSKATGRSRRITKGKMMGKVMGFAKSKRMMQASMGRKPSNESKTESSSVNQSDSQPAMTIPNAQSQTTPLRSVSHDSPLTPSMTKPSMSHDTKKPSESKSSQGTTSATAQRAKSLDPKLLEEQQQQQQQQKEDIVVPEDTSSDIDDATVNDTLKVIFVGMAMAGKTSMIKRLIEGENAVIPKRDERTVGVDIYEWDTKVDKRFEHIDSRIEFQDKELEAACGDVNVKFSVWDFAGQHVYHATHELFFSQRALYVVVWDMGATNQATKQQKTDYESSQGAFRLSYSSDENSDEEDAFASEEEARRADRALERDIDDKVQFWVDCIQSSAPGAAILPVASFDDIFEGNGDNNEAVRRCNIMKKRLLRHEARRLQGIRDRLKEFHDQNRANDEGALRLRKLLGSYTRPKLIFGEDGPNSVVRVSGTKYTGFAELTERIVHLATGRNKYNFRYPIFRGHVGARIPRMRLEVREAVRKMRDRFKVVEWGYFINQLRENELTSVEDISDALHFLTNIGELSYFGGVLSDRESSAVGNQEEDASNFPYRANKASSGISINDESSALSEDDDDENVYLSMDNTSITAPTTDDGSITTVGDSLAGGLSQFVFLNPRWLVAAVACILRHDLDREIQETRRALQSGQQRTNRSDSFYEVNLNCPVITADDACMLWQAKKFTKKAAERALEYSNNMALKPFDFLQLLLVRFGVFVPIDLGIEKAFLGGKEYSRRLSNEDQHPDEIIIGESNPALRATFFFLPSLLGPGEPSEVWTYKSTDSWKATLCHSVLFPDGVPPGLMERITASVLSNMYAIAHEKDENLASKGMGDKGTQAYEGKLSVKEVLCWRTAFLVKVGMQVNGQDGEIRESIVEVFCGLVDKDSHLCVGSEYMSTGMRRLITSGKGQEGDGGRNIWKGGYLIVCKAVQRVMDEYGGLEYEKQGFCPECLAKKAVGEASSWDFTFVRGAVKNGEDIIRCGHGHRVDIRLVGGPVDLPSHKTESKLSNLGPKSVPIVPINDLLRGVVVVGLWDGKTRKVVRVGSGFIADKKRGLIVTAAHTLLNIWGDRRTPFGEDYYGLRQGKVVIGIIPRNKGEETGTEAVFRYFAKIVAKDPLIEQGLCQLDACILRITTRMENDVAGDGAGCGDQIEKLLLNNPHALKQERFHQLKITDKCELDEQVRIVGYNQGGEGLLGPGISLNRYVDFARGYVCKKFAGGETEVGQLRHRFKPREEIVIICPTIGGHSGGPCVNQQGEVIGILSRADPAENQRCYLVPTYEWRSLLRKAKNYI